jgi:hypothetical protein
MPILLFNLLLHYFAYHTPLVKNQAAACGVTMGQRGINFVAIMFKEGDHTQPGIFSRTDFVK